MTTPKTCKNCPHLEHWEDENNPKQNQWDCGHPDGRSRENDGLSFLARNRKTAPQTPRWCPLTLPDRGQLAFSTFQSLIALEGHQRHLDRDTWECPFCQIQYLDETEVRRHCKCSYCKGLGSTAKQLNRMIDDLVDSARELGKTDMAGAIERLQFVTENFRGSYWSSEARMTLRALKEAVKTPDLKLRVKEDVLPVLTGLMQEAPKSDAITLMNALEKLPANDSETRRVFTVMLQILKTDTRWAQYTATDYKIMHNITEAFLSDGLFIPMDALKTLDRLYHSHVSIQGESFKSC